MNYDGPVYKKANEQKKRRFQSHSVKQKRQFELKQPSLLDDTARSTTRYTLPESAKGLRQYQNLTPPVNAKTLNHRIEQANLTDSEAMVPESEYQVPFLNKTKKTAVWKTAVAQESDEKVSAPNNKRTLSHHYQPALKSIFSEVPKVTESVVEASPVKSIDTKNIRTISTRLIKDKSSYLLFVEVSN
ncbi:hypothetical protein KBI51_04935 [Aerococcaceae bacterium zg-ZUI334]|uniref:hypothetical protein n=1 Tax=Aerococcaceae TaxID=186827 RepID=UPI0013BD6AA1|nr:MULTISPECIES: hypothetical protein [unclassified Facklamia]MBR7927517.1 hypothetical protein [Aerococcaceae bacterium zg-ZUI334]NEW64184.1 hypothetical protein [Facklamia sp. 252]NEW68271.1 hypothetical protein [Facklamia sp. 253]QQD65888.1 hypothetical protein JDW14_01840 [Aerococcaceae bacterium zg-252]